MKIVYNYISLLPILIPLKLFRVTLQRCHMYMYVYICIYMYIHVYIYVCM